jgi:hypothetical protein
VIFNAVGEKIKSFEIPRAAIGQKWSVNWDGSDKNGNQLSAGVYFCRLIAGEQQITRKIVKLD